MKSLPITIKFRWKPAIQIFFLIIITAQLTSPLRANSFFDKLDKIDKKLRKVEAKLKPKTKYPPNKPANNQFKAKNDTEDRISGEAIAAGAAIGVLIPALIKGKHRKRNMVIGGIGGAVVGKLIADHQIKNLRNAKMKNQDLAQILNEMKRYNSAARNYNIRLKQETTQLKQTLRNQSIQLQQKQRQLKQQSVQLVQKQQQLQQQSTQLARKQHQSPQLAQKRRQLRQQSVQLAQKQRNLQQQSTQLKHKQHQLQQNLKKVVSGAQNKKREIASTISNSSAIAGALEPRQQQQLKKEIQVLRAEDQKLTQQLKELSSLNKTVRIG